jgi:phage gpG-like protein
MSNPADVIKTMEEKVRAVMKTLPRLAGNEVVNFSKDNFRRQGFLGDSVEYWPARKVQGKRKGRAILVDTGRLRRATRVISADWNEVKVGNDTPYAKAHNEGLRIQVTQNVRAFRRKVSSRNVKGITGGGRLNKKGTAQRLKTGTVAHGVTFVKAHTRKVNMKLPKRKFLGNSPYLNRNIGRMIASQLQKALQ